MKQPIESAKDVAQATSDAIANGHRLYHLQHSGTGKGCFLTDQPPPSESTASHFMIAPKKPSQSS